MSDPAREPLGTVDHIQGVSVGMSADVLAAAERLKAFVAEFEDIDGEFQPNQDMAMLTERLARMPSDADAQAAVVRLQWGLRMAADLGPSAIKWDVLQQALALLTERLAQAEGALTDRDRAYDALTERLARLEAMLTDHQWDRELTMCCLSCAGDESTGHDASCPLATLLPPATEGR